jgi:hypothetical protein
MKPLLILSTAAALIFGLLLGLYWGQPMYRQAKELVVFPRVLSWEELVKHQSDQPEWIETQARVWCEDGICRLMEPVSSLNDWKVHETAFVSGSAYFQITDESASTRSWTLPAVNGGFCRVRGQFRFEKTQTKMRGELLEISTVELNQPISASWEEITQHQSHYHRLVIGIQGVVGKHPTLSAVFLYRDLDAWTKRDHSKAVPMNRAYYLSKQANFSLLEKDGVKAQITGVFERAYADDNAAPNGRIALIHTVLSAQ